MATTNQAAASALGVTLTGTQATDDENIMHALSGASEASKSAFFSLTVSPTGHGSVAQNYQYGESPVTRVLDANNHPVDVSALGSTEQSYYDSLNSEHAKNASELDQIFSTVLGDAPTSDHVTANSNTYSSTGGIHAVVSTDTGDTGSAGGGGGGNTQGSDPSSPFGPNFSIPETPHGIPLTPAPSSPVKAVPGTATTGTGTSSGSGSGTGSGSGETTTSTGVDPTISRLLDLVSQQYSGGGSGGGSGGIVALPTGIDSSGGTSPSSSSGTIAKLLLIGGLVALTFWFYNKHKNGGTKHAAA